MRGILALAQMAVLLCLFTRIFGLVVPARVSWVVAGFTVAVCTWVTFADPSYRVDARIFWTAGRDIWEGHDPYARSEFLSPPTALPVFALFSLMPLPNFLTAWAALCFVCYAMLVPACYYAVRPVPETPGETLSASDLALLSGTLLASVAVRFGIALGQIPALVALAAVGAIACRARSRPIRAGLALVLTSIKPTTMIPFLLLFPPWKQLRTWAALAIGGFALTFTAVRPSELFDLLQRNLENIKNAGLAGAVNDYSFEGAHTVDLLGLEYGIYHLGLRDRDLVGVAHLVAAAALGVFLAWQIYRRKPLGIAAAASIVACYSAIFIYHRQYDAIFLAIPLVYTVARAVSDDSWRRWVYRGCVLGILAVLYEPLRLNSLYAFAQRPCVACRLAEAILLPVATWVIVAISIVLASIERRRLDAIHN